jgi:hypothetical protein
MQRSRPGKTQRYTAVNRESHNTMWFSAASDDAARAWLKQMFAPALVAKLDLYRGSAMHGARVALEPGGARS